MPAPGSARRSPILVAAALAAWFALLLAPYHRSFPPGTIPAHAATLLMAAMILLSAAALGSPIVARIAPGSIPGPLSWLLALGIGTGALEMLVFGLLGARLARPAAAWVILGCGAVAIARRSPSWLEPLGEAATQARQAAHRWWARPAAGLALLAWSIALLAALAPAEFYDALLYHLAVPERHLRSGAFRAIEGHYFAQFPANQGMLYALGMLLVGDRITAGTLAQILHWAAGGAAAAVTFIAGARWFSPRVGLLAACLVATVPGILLVATYPIVDLALTFGASLVLAAILEAQGASAVEVRRRWIVMAGILSGLAIGTKYTAVLTVVAPSLAWLLWRARRGGDGRAADPGIFLLAAAAAFAPWAARNAVLYGNPIAPYLSGLFGSRTSGLTLAEELTRRLPEGGGAGGLLAYYLLAPWNATVEALGAGGYLGLAFVLLIPFVLIRGGRPPAVAPVAVFAAVALAGWTAGAHVTRYLFPAVPALALLAAQGAATIGRASAGARAVLACALGWVLLHNVYLFGVLAIASNPFGVALGVETQGDYLARRVAYYPAAEFINTRLSQEAKVLLVGEGRGYYIERAYEAGTPFDDPILGRYAERAAGEGVPLRLLLRREGFTHLLVHPREMDRIAAMWDREDYFARAGPAAREEILSLLTGRGSRRVFERSGVSVLEIGGD